MKNMAHIAGMALNQPLFLEPAYAQVFFSGLGEKLNISELMSPEGELILPEGMEQLAGSYNPSPRRDRSYRVENGVAVLPVDGTLVHKFGYLKPSSGMTGYDGILARAQQAMEDPDVKGILLDQDSPGGSVAGCFDTTAALQKLEKEGGKPIWSLCYDMTCSASMAIACGASKRLITSNGRAGSVGVIMAHSSHEKQLKEEGIKVTLITSGAHKADGNPYEDIPQKVLENFQRDTDALRNEFAEIVASATNRKTSHVLGTEAQVYRGQEAIDIGFADDLVNGHEAVAYFGEFLSIHNKPSFQVGASAMSDPANPAEGAENKGPKESAVNPVDATQLEAARADERTRIKSITGSEEAKGREGLATHFAHNTNMSADDAVSALAASPKNSVAPAASSSALDQHMGSDEQPNIGAESNSQSEAEEDPVAGMLNSFKAATGRDLGAK
jgi:ClpP class serine protease